MSTVKHSKYALTFNIKAQKFMTDATHRADYRSAIHLFVGPEAVEITMHMAIACRNSHTIDRLHNLYNDRYLELGHYDPDTFLDFVEFCYSGSTTTGSDTLCSVANYQNLAHLYRLAESLGSDTLVNHCVDRILQEHEKLDEVPEAAEVALLWESARDKPGLKALLVDLWVFAEVDVMAVHAELPTEFVAMLYTTKGDE